MKQYLPSDATIFLLDYELGDSIADLYPNRGFGRGRGKELYKQQLKLMASGKIDELIARNYHKDAMMVAFDCVHRGHSELKEYYVDTLKLMGKVTYLATEYFAEFEDVVLFKAVITSEGRGTVHADNALYIKDGKIYRHQALTLLPDADYDKLVPFQITNLVFRHAERSAADLDGSSAPFDFVPTHNVETALRVTSRRREVEASAPDDTGLLSGVGTRSRWDLFLLSSTIYVELSAS
jgi:hypothetical protein